LQLTKIRHPQVLHVEHPLEESTSSLMFVTEPVFASLANILGNSFNLGHPIKYKLHDIEIKYGLMQLCEGLGFLHNECKLLHRNICPESVIINQQVKFPYFLSLAAKNYFLFDRVPGRSLDLIIVC
jgi:SCY1-like protein 2